MTCEFNDLLMQRTAAVVETIMGQINYCSSCEIVVIT